MKLHVSARNGHHQVSTPIKRILYLCVGCVDVEISTHHPLFVIAECVYLTNRKRYCRNVGWTLVYPQEYTHIHSKLRQYRVLLVIYTHSEIIKRG